MSDGATAKKKYMVVEHFKDAAAVYRRFRERGRMAPDGLVYITYQLGSMKHFSAAIR